MPDNTEIDLDLGSFYKFNDLINARQKALDELDITLKNANSLTKIIREIDTFMDSIMAQHDSIMAQHDQLKIPQ